MKFEWKTVLADRNSIGFNTLIAKVHGGWVLKNMCWDEEHNMQSECMVFIPDANHEWEFEYED